MPPPNFFVPLAVQIQQRGCFLVGEGVDYRHEHDEDVEVFSSVRFVFDNLTERVDDFVDVDF